MRLATVRSGGTEQAAVAASGGLVLLAEINRQEGTAWSVELLEQIRQGQLDGLKRWMREGGEERIAGLPAIPEKEADYAPLYRHPRKIWGIGMNYVADPAELASVPPGLEPVSFMKPDTALIGPGDTIRIPPETQEPTAEAELAIIIGKECKNISESEAKEAVAGFAASLDMTAADIHARNQRFLTRAKSFDTFFSFGPQLVTADEVPDVMSLGVETHLNGELRHRNVVSNMRYNPWFIVSFHSRVMTLLPGDIIMTGTPGAVPLREGDTAECRIDGFAPLRNPVGR